MLKPDQDKPLEPSCGRLLLVEDDKVFCDPPRTGASQARLRS